MMQKDCFHSYKILFNIIEKRDNFETIQVIIRSIYCGNYNGNLKLFLSNSKIIPIDFDINKTGLQHKIHHLQIILLVPF